jgi:zinc transport system substrate-binding protein
MPRLSALPALLLAAAATGAVAPVSPRPSTVVVTTSLLESAVREVLPPDANIRVVCLLPPSSCPGHFDLSPRMVPLLRLASLVIRHDYQSALDEKLADMGVKDVSLVAVTAEGSLLDPDVYRRMVEQAASALRARYPGREAEFNTRVARVQARIESLEASMRERAKPWKETPVIASFHQKLLCERLGFEVTEVLKRSEELTPRDWERLLRARAEMVVANLQEGSGGAESLGNRKHLPVAVLSNFPGVPGYGADYYGLMDANLRRLEAAWRKR